MVYDSDGKGSAVHFERYGYRWGYEASVGSLKSEESLSCSAKNTRRQVDGDRIALYTSSREPRGTENFTVLSSSASFEQ